MKKNILYLFLMSLLVACTVKKPEQRSRFLKGFATQYNTLFNAKDALGTELDSRDKSHRDNFYAPYINILTYDEQPLGSDIEQSSAFKDNIGSPSFNANENFGGSPIVGQNSLDKKGASVLEIAESKALKAIDKFSVTRDGEEKNKAIFDAYITLAQSRIYMGKYLTALDALNSIFTHMKKDKRIPLAKIYQGWAYAKMGDYFRANEIFAKLKNENLKSEYKKLASIYYSESLLQSGKKEAAALELKYALEINSNRKIKSRIAFLRGQVLSGLGQNEQARENFVAAYKYANDFEFEVKSQIEIAKTYNGKSDYIGAKKYLEDISKKGTYASRKNEFYYALGLMADKANKKDEANFYYRKSLKEKVSDPQIRGLAYYEIGKGYFAKNDYLEAGAFYDSAIAVMTYTPTKNLIAEQSAYIKKLSKNYYLVKKNDSILALTKMSDAEKNSYFTKYIAKIKAKEEAEDREKSIAERDKDFLGGDYNANSIFGTKGNSASFQDFGNSTKGFYFANTSTVSKGVSEFKQIWGNRSLSDNWRYSQKMTSISDVKNEALGISGTRNPRRFEPSYYIEKIPTDTNLLSALKKDRDTAALGMGIMYDDYFSNIPLATQTLYQLVDNKPEEKVMLRALYKIFSMNYEKNPSAAQRAKEILINEYPYTSYAEFARNPKGGSFMKSDPAAELAYKTAFALYQTEKFSESKALIEKTIKDYPKDALIPKLNLLYAMNTGKTAGKEVMILQLEQIALNYENIDEGKKAKEMLNWLKSEVQVQMTDANGNTISSPQPPAQQPAYEQKMNEEMLRDIEKQQKESIKNAEEIKPSFNPVESQTPQRPK